MELKKLYGPKGKIVFVEPDSQGEEELKSIGYAEEKPKEKKPVKKAK